MSQSPTKTPESIRKVRFAAFEVDLRSGELRKHGVRLKLQDQPFQILALLLERPGEIVTREELRKRLWPADTFVDFDVGLNTAVKRLRDVLGDSAEGSRYVETLPRRGYRFIASVERIDDLSVHTERSPEQWTRLGAVLQPGKLWSALGLVAAILALLLSLNISGFRQRFLRASAATKVHSLAVLPLENLTGDPSQDYFADGMTEALITDLGKIGQLRVISRTSVMKYKGTEKSDAATAKRRFRLRQRASISRMFFFSTPSSSITFMTIRALKFVRSTGVFSPL
jgi:DNA-binding winged helix-turn-helix (wHTH) protein